MYHPREDIERLYIKRENGREGLIQQELTTVGLNAYLDITTD